MNPNLSDDEFRDIWRETAIPGGTQPSEPYPEEMNEMLQAPSRPAQVSDPGFFAPSNSYERRLLQEHIAKAEAEGNIEGAERLRARYGSVN